MFVTTITNDITQGRHDQLYKNELTNGNWFKLKTTGIISNRNGYGARVEVVFGNRKLIREVDGGSSYNSHNSSIVHFGLGMVNVIDTLRILWPSGITDVYTNVGINTCLKAIEGHALLGINEKEDLPSVSKFEVFPNPARDAVTFDLNFNEAINASIAIYDMLGNEIQVIAADKYFKAGANRLTVQVPSTISSGVYICRVVAGSFQLHRNLIILK